LPLPAPAKINNGPSEVVAAMNCSLLSSFSSSALVTGSGMRRSDG
jgi:hypothetical protein